MEIIQIIGIAIISTILCLFIKKDRPEFANFIAITAGVIILLSVILKLNFIVEEINKLADRANNKANRNSLYYGICSITLQRLW